MTLFSVPLEIKGWGRIHRKSSITVAVSLKTTDMGYNIDENI